MLQKKNLLKDNRQKLPSSSSLKPGVKKDKSGEHGDGDYDYSIDLCVCGLPVLVCAGCFYL